MARETAFTGLNGTASKLSFLLKRPSANSLVAVDSLLGSPQSTEDPKLGPLLAVWIVARFPRQSNYSSVTTCIDSAREWDSASPSALSEYWSSPTPLIRPSSVSPDSANCLRVARSSGAHKDWFFLFVFQTGGCWRSWRRSSLGLQLLYRFYLAAVWLASWPFREL